MTKKEDKLIPVHTVAEMLGLNPDTIYKGKAGTHELKRVRLGRSVRWSYLQVIDWIEKKKAEGIEAERAPQKTVRLRLIKRPVLDRRTVDRILHKK